MRDIGPPDHGLAAGGVDFRRNRLRAIFARIVIYTNFEAAFRTGNGTGRSYATARTGDYQHSGHFAVTSACLVAPGLPSCVIAVKRSSRRYLALPSQSVIVTAMREFELAPDPDDPRLTETVAGIDHKGEQVETRVVAEKPLTLYLNGQEIVTMMTIGDYPEYLAVGYLLNQNMLPMDDEITAIDFDAEIDVVVVRTAHETDFEEKLKKKTLTSGCAQGTQFGDMMEQFDEIAFPEGAILKTSWIYSLSAQIHRAPSLYLSAGAIHGCVLCEEDRPLVYMEDVGRHNAVDKIAGWMYVNKVGPENKLFYTTGRLTSEMVLKTAQMGIPILISRSGFTAWGVDLARQVGMTLIGRARGQRFVCLSGAERLHFDVDPDQVREEAPAVQRKAARRDSG
jgi:FdhD protein